MIVSDKDPAIFDASLKNLHDKLLDTITASHFLVTSGDPRSDVIFPHVSRIAIAIEAFFYAEIRLPPPFKPPAP
jgi:hypothetical protein